MLCTVWSICIDAHILHVDICCKASFISCLIKTRDGITYIIIIYIYIYNIIPYYNFGIKKNKIHLHNSNMELFHTMHSWKKNSNNQGISSTCCRDLPRAPTLPSITYSGFSKRQYTKNTSVEALLHQKGTTYNDIYIPTNTY